MSTNGKGELIRAASTRVFPRLGYHRTTVEDILKEAGVARSTFYVYFSNKRELFTSVVTGIVEEVLQTVESGVDSIADNIGNSPSAGADDIEVEQALVDLMADVFHYIEKNRGMTRIFLHELVGIDKQMTRLFKGFQDRVTDQFERLIHIGEELGVLREVNQRRAADFIVGGLIHLARNISSGIEKYNVDSVSREFVELHLRGLLKRAGTQ